MPHFEIFSGRNKQFYWRLVGRNGQIMAASEGYTSKSSVRRAVVRFQNMLSNYSVEEFEIKEGKK